MMQFFLSFFGVGFVKERDKYMDDLDPLPAKVNRGGHDGMADTTCAVFRDNLVRLRPDTCRDPKTHRTLKSKPGIAPGLLCLNSRFYSPV